MSLWLTSTSMHSLSFLQVADMVSVVPNSKYQSLFFILRKERGHRGHTNAWENMPSPNLSMHMSTVLRAYGVICLGCTEHILKLSAASSHLTFWMWQLMTARGHVTTEVKAPSMYPKALKSRRWQWQHGLFDTEPQRVNLTICQTGVLLLSALSSRQRTQSPQCSQSWVEKST